MKQLTVITVTYNAEKVVEKTLLSVIGQTVFDTQIEYIIVDGASKDKTLEIVARYDKKITRIVSEPDHGIYDAMNKGIELATTPWICFMNAGDTFLDDKVVASLNLESEGHPKILYGDCIKAYADKDIRQLSKAKPFFNYPGKITGVGICHQAVYASTELMKEHPFRWQTYPHCADFEFLWAMYEQKLPFKYVDRPLCIYDYGQGYSSNQTIKETIFDENARISHLKYSIDYWKRKLRQLLK